MTDKLCIDLEKRIDNDGKVFYLAKLKAPILLDAKDGICFLIFTSDEGLEQMQIGPMTSKRDRTMYDK